MGWGDAPILTPQCYLKCQTLGSLLRAPVDAHGFILFCWTDDLSIAGTVQWLFASLTWCLARLLLEH